MIRYSLYVGTGDSRLVALVVARYVPGATVIPTIGIWNQCLEKSTLVQIIVDRDQPARIDELAEDLRSIFEQESVFVTNEPIEMGSGAPVELTV